MEHSARASWTDTELAELLAEYFGENLSPPQLERLTPGVSAALAERRGRTDAFHKGEDCHGNPS